MDTQGIVYQYNQILVGRSALNPNFEGEFVSRAGLRTSPQESEILASKSFFSLGRLFVLVFLIAGFTATTLYFSSILAEEVSTRLFQNPSKAASIYPLPDSQFSIVIPKISVSAKVFPNISPVDEKKYLAVLKNGVAHADGTALPGQKGNIYFFAHSADLSGNLLSSEAIFRDLGELIEGDQILISFAGRGHLYRVFEKKILPASDISYFTPQNKEELLVLQTCWPVGTTQERLLVFAKKA